MVLCMFRPLLIINSSLRSSSTLLLASISSHYLRPSFGTPRPRGANRAFTNFPSHIMTGSIPNAAVNTATTTSTGSPSQLDATQQERHALFIYPSSQSGRIGFDFFLPAKAASSVGGKNARLHLDRSSDETVGKFLERLSAGVNKGSGVDGNYDNRKKHCPDRPVVTAPPSPPEIRLYRQSATDGCEELCEIDAAQSLGSAFARYLETSASVVAKPLFLRLLLGTDRDLLFTVTFNPARVITCRLDLLPMVGCPVVPQLEAVNLSIEHSEFLWFVTKTDRWPSEPCHRGFIFYPKAEHLGGRLRLRVGARDSNAHPGVPFGNARQYDLFGEPVECKWPISAAPIASFPENRMKVDSNYCLGDDGFRVVSYNLLADMYASCESARNIIFRHCPERCLEIKYRLPLILRELITYSADFLCLQEVDKWAFKNYLQPALASELDMKGVYLGKRLLVEEPDNPGRIVVQMDQEKNEGCAIFYRSSKFELVRQAHLPSIMAYAAQRPNMQPLLAATESEPEAPRPDPEHFKRDWRTHREKCKSHCLLVTVFRVRASPQQQQQQSDRFLVVANTHLYFHPAADALRFIQASAIHDHLSTIIQEIRAQSSLPVPVILGGDINQSPDGPAYLALLGDSAPTSFPDNNSESTREAVLRMQPAYEPDPELFTNWVPDFKASLDVILYDRQSGLNCRRAYPLCTAAEITRLAKEQTAHGTEEPDRSGAKRPVQEADLYALPNVAFPSDHLALVADFSWSTDS